MKLPPEGANEKGKLEGVHQERERLTTGRQRNPHFAVAFLRSVYVNETINGKIHSFLMDTEATKTIIKPGTNQRKFVAKCGSYKQLPTTLPLFMMKLTCR